MEGGRTKVESKRIDEYFKDLARTKPDNIALVKDGEIKTYSEICKRAEAIAKVLSRLINRHQLMKFTGNDVIIGTFMSPSFDRVAANLAILQLGGSVLPLDALQPIYRLKYILRETRPACVIASNDWFKQINDQSIHAEGVRIIEMDEIDEDIKADKGSNEILTLSEDISPLAYIIYTSGSTGASKGVRLRHSNLMNRLHWQWNTFPFTEGDIGVVKSSQLFVDSLTELYGCLLKGIPLLILSQDQVTNPETFVNCLYENKVTRLVVVPSLLKNVLTYVRVENCANKLASLKVLVSSGETLPISLAEEYFNITKDFKTKLVNFYGSTEITGDVTSEVFQSHVDIQQKSNNGKLSIGKAIDNTLILLVNEEMEEVTEGKVGEIFVGGANLAEGYQGNVELSDSPFIKNCIRECKRYPILYKTSDFASLRNGSIIYEGRKDSLIKIRGQRLNLSEIEGALNSIEGVKKSCALQYSQSENNMRILAFYCGNVHVSEEKVKENLGKFLPPFMMPHLVLIEEIPLLKSTGKVDRNLLLQIYKNNYINEEKGSQLDSFSEEEEFILDIFRTDLGSPRGALSLTDRLMDHGFNSVNAVSVLAKLKEKGYDLCVEDFMKSSSVNDLIKIIQRKMTDSVESLRYIIKPLEECVDYKDEIFDSLNAGLLFRQSYIITVGTTEEEGQLAFNSTFDMMLESGASQVCFDADTNKYLGTALLCEESTEALPDFDSYAVNIITECNEELKKAGDHLRKGRWLESFLVGTTMDLNAELNLKVMYMLEKASIEKAKELKYDGILTVNISPVTKVITEDLGYTRIKEIKTNEWVAKDGSKPFAKCPEDHRLTLNHYYIDNK